MEKGIESNVDFSPTDDLLFKLIFSDKRCEHLLIHLLNSVLDSKNNPVTEVHIENTEVVPDVFDGRGVRLDVCAKTEDGRLCDIEIQKADKGNMFERSLFYWARLFSRRLNKNDSFGKLRQTICINILEFNLFKDKDEYWNTYHITNDRNGTRYKSDLLELHFIEMGKMHGFSKDCPLTLWVEYLKNPLSKTVKKIMEFEPIIEEAVNMFKTISDDPKTREMIRMREEGILDYNSAIDHAEQIGKLKGLQEGERIGLQEGERKGLQEGERIGKLKGLQEGERKGKLIAARSMLTDGVPVAVVSKYTGIPIAELKDFKDIREE